MKIAYLWMEAYRPYHGGKLVEEPSFLSAYYLTIKMAEAEMGHKSLVAPMAIR